MSVSAHASRRPYARSRLRAADKSVSLPPSGGAIDRPPMGWNSWNCYGVDVREQQVRTVAEYMHRRLGQHGWEYVVIDACWYLEEGITTANFKMPRPAQRIDEHGRLLPALHKFPSARGGAGFKPLADYVHSLGLKFGLHIMRGIPWQAVDSQTPILGSRANAADISDPDDLCPWYHGMAGVKASSAAGAAYYRSLIELYASWGVDFLKADDISFPYHADDIAALRRAIARCGRPMLLSLSPGPTPVGALPALARQANLWRISPDFWDDWRLLHRQFSLCRHWQLRGRPGAWPDCDMLPLGRLRITGPDDYSIGEMGVSAEQLTNEFSRFTTDEKRTLMTLWCMFRSPLFFGGYLPDNDPLTTRLITHRELIGINQYSSDNREVYFDDGTSVWTARSARARARYFAVFNLRDAGRTGPHVARWRDLGITRPTPAREVWTDESQILTPGTVATDGVPPHGVRLYRVAE